MTVIIITGIFFSERLPGHHHSVTGDSTNHKWLRMQQRLCVLWKHHWSYDLCWSSKWKQRCMRGNRVMIRINIYIWTIRICNKQIQLILYKLWRMFEILSVKCRVKIDIADCCTNTNVEHKTTCWFTTSYFVLS